MMNRRESHTPSPAILSEDGCHNPSGLTSRPGEIVAIPSFFDGSPVRTSVPRACESGVGFGGLHSPARDGIAGTRPGDATRSRSSPVSRRVSSS